MGGRSELPESAGALGLKVPYWRPVVLVAKQVSQAKRMEMDDSMLYVSEAGERKFAKVCACLRWKGEGMFRMECLCVPCRARVVVRECARACWGQSLRFALIIIL